MAERTATVGSDSGLHARPAAIFAQAAAGQAQDEPDCQQQGEGGSDSSKPHCEPPGVSARRLRGPVVRTWGESEVVAT